VAKVDDILEKIKMLTQRGKLVWTLVGRTSFRSQIDSLYVSITHDRDDDQFTFVVYDDDGNALEASSDYYVGSTHGELFELARRNALRVDESLERLDRRLDDLI
jgi:hypothetical protein